MKGRPYSDENQNWDQKAFGIFTPEQIKRWLQLAKTEKNSGKLTEK